MLSCAYLRMQSTDPRIPRAFRKPCPLREGRFYCLPADSGHVIEEEMHSGINAAKSFLKRWSGLYEFLQAFFGPGASVIPHLTGKKALRRAFTAHELRDKLVLCVGSGVKHLNAEVLNVDVYPFAGVDIVADAANLPFADNTVDMIVCEDTLEHVAEPFLSLAEFKRVLRPRGYIYVAVPFVYPFHASPNDFTRFTRNALRKQLDDFTIIEEGVRAGPMASLQAVLMQSCAMLLSFGNYSLYFVLTNFCMVMFSPLKLLDILFAPFPYAHEAAADIYLFAKTNI